MRNQRSNRVASQLGKGMEVGSLAGVFSEQSRDEGRESRVAEQPLDLLWGETVAVRHGRSPVAW